ncbi:MAG: methyltransferase domain-containing protein [Bacteroidetes bacterium]|jgi:2-polyprenyl-3-methyl-5-hydroxy-6-metoxy-1,4-benzoquinol methylase|nr:methyltransferase domain-containing protein [Bacteroidota bacterium]
MKPWYQELFSNYARRYDNESFTAGTIGECDFIEAEIGGDRSKRILDIGCGTGRHAIEMARRGYSVVGVDLSANMLAAARAKAESAGVRATFLEGDARTLTFRQEFDLAVMLCEGGFALMETDEMNYAILRSAANAVRNGGTFIFTTLNGLFPLYHSVRDFINAGQPQSNSEANTFDLMTFRDRSQFTFTDDSGVTKTVTCDERYYVPPEISWQLRSLGFSTVDIFGARIGQFSRQHTLTPDDYEMLVVARR